MLNQTKLLAIFYGCTTTFVSDLIGNPVYLMTQIKSNYINKNAESNMAVAIIKNHVVGVVLIQNDPSQS